MQDSAAVTGNTVSTTYSGGSSNHYIQGGGIFIQFNSFEKATGVIYGNDGGADYENKAINGQGHAAYNVEMGGNERWRNATAGMGMSSNNPSFWLKD